MNTAAETAIAITRRIKQAIHDAARPLSIPEIAATTGLAPGVISRRLTGNTLGNSTPAFAWFVKSADGAWGLTQRGRDVI